MELFSGGKNTIGTPNLLEKFKIVIIDLLIDKTTTINPAIVPVLQHQFF